MVLTKTVTLLPTNYFLTSYFKPRGNIYLFLIYITFLSQNLFADRYQLDYFIDKVDAKSTYTAKKDDLVARLDFPYKPFTHGLKLSYFYKQYTLSLSIQNKLHPTKTTGEDLDWYKGDLSVYSHSDMKTDSYEKYTIAISENISDILSMTFKYDYKHLKFSWHNTKQTDYVAEKYIVINKKALLYEQYYHIFNIGSRFKYKYKNLLITFHPNIFFLHNKSIDSHLLRSIYTVQKNSGFGYNYKIKSEYVINKSVSISASFYRESFSDKSSNMKYYLDNGYMYDNIKSSMSFYENNYRVAISYKW